MPSLASFASTRLAEYGNLDVNTAGAVNIFDITSDVFITHVVLYAPSISLTTASISFGFNSASYNDVIANSTYTALTASGLYQVVVAKSGAAIGVFGNSFNVKVNTPQGAAATVSLLVFGFYL